MQRFDCECGNPLFFGSSKCLRCGREVGYDAEAKAMTVVAPGCGMKRCGNAIRYGVCNWIVPAGSDEALCAACRLNRTIPDLRDPRNVMLWGRMELAKRRLISTLLHLGITLPSKSESPQSGLAFDIVSSVSNPALIMGHLNGVITVNLEEADDTYRQIHRQQLGETSRTLLGHFRHESGHYVWHRWLGNLPWDHPQRVAFCERFGSDCVDYPGALSTHYARGARFGWEQSFISAYAASHPWEDWAETWAHYLEILEGVATCESLGIEVSRLALPVMPFPVEAGALPPMLRQSPDADSDFLAWLLKWVRLSTTLNDISASLGEPALYPYVLSTRVAQKLRLIHYFAEFWGGSANCHPNSVRVARANTNLSQGYLTARAPVNVLHPDFSQTSRSCVPFGNSPIPGKWSSPG